MDKESIILNKKVAKIAERIANKTKYSIKLKKKTKVAAEKYKVGDKVVVKSLDWYNENKDEYGVVSVPCGFTKEMQLYCGKILTIRRVTEYSYYVKGNTWLWSDEMFEGLAGGIYAYLETKDIKDLPKDFAECAKLFHISEDALVGKCRDVLSTEAEKLRICRKAYWILADWEPDWKKNTKKHCIVERNGKVSVATTISKPREFAFPTPEMANAFGKNFKKELDMCKEILK